MIDDHYLMRCGCGRIVAQCRCPGPKTELVSEKPCTHSDPVQERTESKRIRPLNDDEELLARAASQSSEETRLPAAWAIGQATATATELAVATVDDLDLPNKRIYLVGNKKRDARWGTLTDWGVQQLEHRLDVIAGRDDRRLVYNGKRGTGAKGGWCSAVTEVLTLAGLQTEPGIYAASLAGWAGLRAFKQSGQIEDAARLLGLRSLDATARVIGWDWDPDV